MFATSHLCLPWWIHCPLACSAAKESQRSFHLCGERFSFVEDKEKFVYQKVGQVVTLHLFLVLVGALNIFSELIHPLIKWKTDSLFFSLASPALRIRVCEAHALALTLLLPYSKLIMGKKTRLFCSLHSTELVRMCLACQHFDFNNADWISDNLHVISSWYLRTMEKEFVFPVQQTFVGQESATNL